MLSRPSSSAAVLVSPRTPHLLATYAASPNVAVNPAPEEILTIAPPPALRIEGTTARIPRYEPVRLISSTWRQTAGSVSVIGPKRTIPALLTSTETGPKASSAAAAVAARSLSRVTSRREQRRCGDGSIARRSGSGGNQRYDRVNRARPIGVPDRRGRTARPRDAVPSDRSGRRPREPAPGRRYRAENRGRRRSIGAIPATMGWVDGEATLIPVPSR